MRQEVEGQFCPPTPPPAPAPFPATHLRVQQLNAPLPPFDSARTASGMPRFGSNDSDLMIRIQLGVRPRHRAVRRSPLDAEIAADLTRFRMSDGVEGLREAVVEMNPASPARTDTGTERAPFPQISRPIFWPPSTQPLRFVVLAALQCPPAYLFFS